LGISLQMAGPEPCVYIRIRIRLSLSGHQFRPKNPDGGSSRPMILLGLWSTALKRPL
jgi:hypothetical protein